MLQGRFHSLERGQLEGIGLVLLGAVQPALDQIEIGEDAFGVERFEIGDGVGGRFQGRIRKRPRDETDDFLVTNLHQRLIR